MTKPWTLADISMVVLAAQILEQRGVWHVFGGPARTQREVGMDRHNFQAVLSELGLTPQVVPHGDDRYWKAFVDYRGVRLEALFSAGDLPQIGYHVPAYTAPQAIPVPIQEVTE